MKHLVLVSLWLTSLLWPFALKRTDKNTRKSLSYHVAATVSAMRFAMVVIPLAVACLAGWYFGWYIPTYAPNLVLTILISTMMISCLVIAFVPYHEGTLRGKIHDVASYGGYAALMPFIVLLFAYEARHMLTFTLLIMIVAGMGIFIVASKLYPRVWNYFLYAQAAYIVLFGVGVLIVTYLG